MHRVSTKAILAAFAIALGAGTSQSAAIFKFSQVGHDVVGTLSGSIDLAGAEFIGDTPSYGPSIFAIFGVLNASPFYSGGDFPQGEIYKVSGPASLGSVFATSATTQSGGVFEISGGSMIVPKGYSGEMFDNVLTFADATFATMGINTGKYVYTVTGSGDTVTLDFSAPAVPEPATWALMVSGFGMVGGAMRARKRVNVLFA